MKKLFIAVMAAMMCATFVLPAAADVKITGMIWVDAYVRTISKEVIAGGIVEGNTPLSTTLENGRTDFQINGPLPTNYINFSYVSAKGNYGAAMTIGGGYINDWSTWNNAFQASYIWWKPNDQMRLRVGKLSQFMGGLYPTDSLGMSEYYRELDDPAATGAFSGAGGMAQGVGAGEVPAAISFGNLHTTAKPGFDLNYKVNDMVQVNFGIFDPDYDQVDNDNFTLVSTTGGTAVQEGVLPRFDFSVPIKIGNIYIQPKFGWLRKTYDQVAPNQDDDFDIYVYGADASITFGPVTLAAEYAYGQNLGAGNFTGGLSTQGPRAFTDANGITTISDSDTTLWWGEIRWTITPKVYLTGAYGKLSHENEVNPATTTDDWEINRSFMSIALRYALAPNLFIQPQYSKHWYGDDNRYGTAYGAFGDNLHVDAGTLDLYGVSFFIMF